MSKETPIAILTIKKDISRMSTTEIRRLRSWLEKTAVDIDWNRLNHGKTRFRLMEVSNG